MVGVVWLGLLVFRGATGNFVSMEHSRRTLVKQVDFISAPGKSEAGVYRTGGPVALLRGAAPRCLWIALGGGVFFTALEESRVAVSWMLNRSVAPPASLPVTCCDE